MTLGELLTRLSYGELSNLSIGMSGAGTIRTEDIPKVVSYVNEGMLRLYGRFVLLTKQLLIEQQEHITNYHLIYKYAESSLSDEEFHYIKDIPGEPFADDLIRILEVYNENGCEYVLNDKDDYRSLFTPAPQVLQVPEPVTGKPLFLAYQARHTPITASPLTQELEIPFVLEGALQSYVAYKVFSHMNGQDNMLKSQEHLNTYDGLCMDVEAKDLVNTTFATSYRKLEQRGFV